MIKIPLGKDSQYGCSNVSINNDVPDAENNNYCDEVQCDDDGDDAEYEYGEDDDSDDDNGDDDEGDEEEEEEEYDKMPPAPLHSNRFAWHLGSPPDDDDDMTTQLSSG